MSLEKRDCIPLFFADGFAEYDFARHKGHVVHVLCLKGGWEFSFNGVRHEVLPMDYVILPRGVAVTDIVLSKDCRMIVMSFEEEFVTTNALRSKYGIIGLMSLLQNPVMRLSPHEFEKLGDDMKRLRKRLDEREHKFREEMIGALLKAHVLDLYDIHARANDKSQLASRPMELMLRFVGMLIEGDYVQNRSLEHYAGRLFITPHYLSELSKSVSGRSASYWIELFAIQELSRLLTQTELPLSEIAYRMNFSSVSYLSRFVKKHLGVSPSEFRNKR